MISVRGLSTAAVCPPATRCVELDVTQLKLDTVRTKSSRAPPPDPALDRYPMRHGRRATLRTAAYSFLQGYWGGGDRLDRCKHSRIAVRQRILPVSIYIHTCITTNIYIYMYIYICTYTYNHMQKHTVVVYACADACTYSKKAAASYASPAPASQSNVRTMGH